MLLKKLWGPISRNLSYLLPGPSVVFLVAISRFILNFHCNNQTIELVESLHAKKWGTTHTFWSLPWIHNSKLDIHSVQNDDSNFEKGFAWTQSNNIIFKKQHEFKFRRMDLDHDLIWFPLVLMNIKTPLPFGKVQPVSGGVERPLLILFGGGGGYIYWWPKSC